MNRTLAEKFLLGKILSELNKSKLNLIKILNKVNLVYTNYSLLDF